MISFTLISLLFSLPVWLDRSVCKMAKGERRTARGGKSGKNLVGLQNNPLFRALNGKSTKGSNVSTNKEIPAKLTDNPLLKRLDMYNKNLGKDNRNKNQISKRLANNRLAMALNIVPTLGANNSIGLKPPKFSKSNKKATISKSNRKSSIPKGPSGSGINVMDDNKPTTNRDVTFKNASLIPFMRLQNLTPDASESDIRMVLSKILGPTLKIMKMGATYNGKPSVTAEVFFIHEEKLEEYVQRMDKIQADGRILRAHISYKSWIINSDRLWDSVLKEVAMLKQQQIKRQVLENDGLVLP